MENNEKALSNATKPQLIGIIGDISDMVDEKTRRDIGLCIHNRIYGFHFNESSLDEALKEIGCRYDLSESIEIASEHGIAIEGFNAYDWCYALNHIHLTYGDVLGDDRVTHAEMAKRFIGNDETKPYRHYLSFQ